MSKRRRRSDRSSGALWFLVGCAGCAPAAPAPLPNAEAIAHVRGQALATSEAYATVRRLTDEIGPRLSGSAGSKAAIPWAVKALTAAGLSNVRAEPCEVPHWERGDEGAAIVEPSPQPLSIAALGGSVGTPPEGIEAEVVEVPTLEALDALGAAGASGKIVFIHGSMDRTRDGSGYGAAVRPRGQGAIRAAKAGAIGVLVRSIGTDENRAPHTGAMRYDDGIAKIPAAAIAAPDADGLHRLLAGGAHVRVRMHLGARTLPDAEGANVVGEVTGSELPTEIVVVGGHLDSWDLGKGALDDGAGCAIAIEAGRQIAKLPKHPRRTVRVVLFANEENGLRGARAYAKAHEAELASHVIATEADLGAGRVYEARFLGAPSGAAPFRTMAVGLEPLGVVVSGADAHGGADLLPMLAAGVPVMDLRQDATTYFDYHHSANDTLERVHKGEIDQAAASFATAVFMAADAPFGFGRVPDEKRKSD